jgi:hypothetical protein
MLRVETPLRAFEPTQWEGAEGKLVFCAREVGKSVSSRLRTRKISEPQPSRKEWTEARPDRSSAVKSEVQIKRLPRMKKLELIRI